MIWGKILRYKQLNRLLLTEFRWSYIGIFTPSKSINYCLITINIISRCRESTKKASKLIFHSKVSCLKRRRRQKYFIHPSSVSSCYCDVYSKILLKHQHNNDIIYVCIFIFSFSAQIIFHLFSWGQKSFFCVCVFVVSTQHRKIKLWIKRLFTVLLSCLSYFVCIL